MRLERTLSLAGLGLGLGLILTAGAAFAQATPPLNPPPTVGRSLNDGGTGGMTPGINPRPNRNTGTGGPNTTGSGNDNTLYNQAPMTHPRT